jgi:hypothetical protein
VRQVGALGIALVLFLALALQSVPALAGDRPVVNNGSTTFQALSKMPGETRTNLVPMTDEQLASVEGERSFCFVCLNSARVTQTNRSILTVGNTQSNLALVIQSNN